MTVQRQMIRANRVVAWRAYATPPPEIQHHDRIGAKLRRLPKRAVAAPRLRRVCVASAPQNEVAVPAPAGSAPSPRAEAATEHRPRDRCRYTRSRGGEYQPKRHTRCCQVVWLVRGSPARWVAVFHQ